jgi:hypothetical protein
MSEGIKPNELRIGSFVRRNSTGEEFQVDVMNIAFIEADQKGPYEKSFSPIPLTREWLSRLGFGQSEEHEMGHNQNAIWGFYYDYHFRRLRLEVGDSDTIDVIIPMENVHQLQNIYFVLTGNELLLCV